MAAAALNPAPRELALVTVGPINDLAFDPFGWLTLDEHEIDDPYLEAMACCPGMEVRRVVIVAKEGNPYAVDKGNRSHR